MADSQTRLTDLPIDVLLHVASFLGIQDLFSLCLTTRDLDLLRHDSSYWNRAIRSTFRLPNRPMIQADGDHLAKLYRRLLTQSRVYVWGNNEGQNLGPMGPPQPTYNPVTRPPLPGRRLRRPVRNHSRNSIAWPMKMQGAKDIGIIVDMQCGGWSTTLLNSNGALFTAGVLNGSSLWGAQRTTPAGLRVLTFPPGFPQITDRYDPAIAIAHFSAGRSHVLGLSDSGKIWFWHNRDLPAFEIRLLHCDSYQETPGGKTNNVRRVVAGWDRSSAYIRGTGIAVWEPSSPSGNEADPGDTLIIDADVVPLSSYQRSNQSVANDDSQYDSLGETVGEVVNHIVLEGYILFLTDLGKVFACRTDQGYEAACVIELDTLFNEASLGQDGKITDIQGSFRSFAVFSRLGDVLLADCTFLDQYYDIKIEGSDSELPQPSRPKALQRNGVVYLAFGDYHYLALHASGHISSYGTEPRGCGALGLGAYNQGGMLRGVRQAPRKIDNEMLPHGHISGHRVWFEPEKQDWLGFMTNGGCDPEEASERIRMMYDDPTVQGEVSEWIEQEGRAWDQRFGLTDGDGDGDGDEMALGTYHALTVTAAGWQGGAVVLVDEEAEHKNRMRFSKPIADVTVEREETPSEAVPGAARIGIGEGEVQISSSTPSSTSGSNIFTSMISGIYSLFSQAPGQSDDTAVASSSSSTPTSSTQGPPPEDDVEAHQPIWSNEPFPRLVLSSGLQMPGSIPVAEWRFGRPDFPVELEDVRDKGGYRGSFLR
ncbi:MAG: hypothetical protein M1819_000410 [Sarea resinae]|nr:MAG: hypothetical protein M1819_000410 [Sarea resinae]